MRLSELKELVREIYGNSYGCRGLRLANGIHEILFAEDNALEADAAVDPCEDGIMLHVYSPNVPNVFFKKREALVLVSRILQALGDIG